MLDLLWSKQCLNPDEELIHCGKFFVVKKIDIWLFCFFFKPSVPMQKFESNPSVLNSCFANIKIVERRKSFRIAARSSLPVIQYFSSCLICLHEMPVLDEEYDMDDSDDYEDNMVS